jgi:hypothetical protein
MTPLDVLPNGHLHYTDFTRRHLEFWREGGMRAFDYCNSSTEELINYDDPTTLVGETAKNKHD